MKASSSVRRVRTLLWIDFGRRSEGKCHFLANKESRSQALRLLHGCGRTVAPLWCSMSVRQSDIKVTGVSRFVGKWLVAGESAEVLWLTTATSTTISTSTSASTSTTPTSTTWWEPDSQLEQVLISMVFENHKIRRTLDGGSGTSLSKSSACETPTLLQNSKWLTS